MAKYFTEQETEGLDAKFIEQLDKARDIAGIPFTITSGFRSPEKNQSVTGAVPDSAHLQGLAVDLLVENSHQVCLILKAAFAVGINRIGIYVNSEDNMPTHVHLDVATDRLSEVIWIKHEGQRNSGVTTV